MHTQSLAQSGNAENQMLTQQTTHIAITIYVIIFTEMNVNVNRTI